MGDKKEKKVLVYNSEAPIEEQVVSLLKGLKKTITTAESITKGRSSFLLCGKGNGYWSHDGIRGGFGGCRNR